MDSIKTIICDDDQGNLDVLELLLELDGYRIIKVNDSAKLIEKIREQSPDILLVDLWMPMICGHEIIKIIRKNPELYQLPIIAFSASHDGEQIALGAGADYYVSKPFDIEEIIEAIKKLLI